jgi:hypothetical protein
MMSNSKVWVMPAEASDYSVPGYGSEGLLEGESTGSFPPLVENVLNSLEEYGREKPLTFGLWMMGIGFVLGWKLKIW